MKNTKFKTGEFAFLIIYSFLYLHLAGCNFNSHHSENSRIPQKNMSDFSQNISVNEAFEMISKNENDLVILDVRTKGEYDEDHIANCINYDFYSEKFKENLSRLDKDKIYIVYCRVGRRSGIAADMMKEMGFKTMYNVQGGILKWKENSLPLVK